MVNPEEALKSIRFGWLIDAAVTANAGDIIFEIMATGVNEKGNNYIWRTRPNGKFTVLQGLNYDGIIEPSEDWYTSFVNMILGHVAEAKQYADEAKASAASINVDDIKADVKTSVMNDLNGTVTESLKAYYTKTEVDTKVKELNTAISGIDSFLRADGAWVIPTNTTYSVGTSSYLGITKLYTETGSATDGTMTQNAITTALNGKSPTSHTHNYAGSSSSGGAANSANKLATARTVSGGTDITLSFNYDGSGNSSANIGFYSSSASVGDKNNYPFHRFAKLDTIAASYSDKSTTFFISQDYSGGGFGIVRIVLRTNNSSLASTVEVKWLVRCGLSADSVQVGIYNVFGKTYADAFFKTGGSYAGTCFRTLASGARGGISRTWVLVNSSEVSGTSATDAKTSTECYATIAAAGTALHKQAYSSIVSGTDSGTASYANSAGSANSVAWGNVTGKPSTFAPSSHIYTGGVGSISGNGKADGGFPNGGSSWASSTSEGAGGGGGSSDIRIGTDSLYARVIVAGGGGGGGEDNETGGYGGGETGGTSGSGTPGSQTAPSGYFGIGGHTSYDGGGGGGGWYGADPAGGQTTPATGSSGSDTSGSPGGSGYVYTSATASNYPSGCLLNSSYYLSAAKTIAGNTSFTSPTGSSETGHSGNGYCRITVIECKNTALYTRINNSMKKATAFYFKLNNNKMYGVGSANYNGSVMNFDYTGSVQTVTLAPGTYKLECWGAQGGNGSSNGNSNINAVGGLGGYSVGTITLSKTQKVYIYSGGKGQTKSNTGSYSTVNGGFNGGGSNYTCGSGGSGGGGSDIRIGTDSLYARVIVAGGGSGTGWTIKGAAGGGILGLSNYNSSYNSTQTAGGIAYTSAYNIMPTAGTFGIGGNGSGSSEGGSGGGGGWYGGGGAGYTGGSSGGSGYVYTSVTASNYPNGCLLNSSYYLSNAQTIAGDQSFPAPSGSTETGHSGNGHVKITKLSDVIYLTHAKNNIMDFNYTGSVQSKTLKPGTYTIECWGGQGGTYSSYIGGYGGYSKGTITLTEATTVYISVGGAGSSSSTAAGFNGGGTGISSGRGGGGATDVRIGQNSLYSRVIVAGGGGGAGVTSANANPCGCGGGEYGGDGYYNDTTGSYTIGQNRCGGSASQTAGGKTWSTSTQATFGQGGNASGYSCGGGGGGWYGGGGAYDSDSDSDGRWGGGGSGYVYTSSTAKNYPNGCLLNSTHYLTNAQTIAGNTSFTSPTGSAETGHTGSGFCRITNLNPTQYGLYVKTNSGWKHIDL